jgi:hypothetical protein
MLHAVARDGSAVQSQGHYYLPLVVSNSAFSCRLLSPTSGTVTVLGSNISAEASVTNVPGAVTQVVFHVEGKSFSADTAAPWQTVFDTRTAGTGKIEVQAEAFDSTGVRSFSDTVEVDVRMSPTIDSDGDGCADEWEQHYFGGLYVYHGTNDPDADLADNYNEYTADTDPENANSLFEIEILRYTNACIDIRFLSSTGRQYESMFNDQFATNTTAWQTASPSPFRGSGGLTNWVDDGGETGTHPSQQVQRIYRIEVSVP